jgi:mono/diheme cytochrome c family protein
MTSRVTWGLVALAAISVFSLAVPLALGSTKPPAKKHQLMPGNVVSGKKVFVQFCGKCHMMRAAGSRGTIGPNLDQDTAGVNYSRVVTAVREGIGGIQAEYTFARKCSPTSPRCLTWNQLHDVAKFVVTKRPGGVRAY